MSCTEYYIQDMNFFKRIFSSGLGSIGFVIISVEIIYLIEIIASAKAFYSV